MASATGPGSWKPDCSAVGKRRNRLGWEAGAGGGGEWGHGSVSADEAAY